MRAELITYIGQEICTDFVDPLALEQNTVKYWLNVSYVILCIPFYLISRCIPLTRTLDRINNINWREIELQ